MCVCLPFFHRVTIEIEAGKEWRGCEERNHGKERLDAETRGTKKGKLEARTKTNPIDANQTCDEWRRKKEIEAGPSWFSPSSSRMISIVSVAPQLTRRSLIFRSRPSCNRFSSSGVRITRIPVFRFRILVPAATAVHTWTRSPSTPTCNATAATWSQVAGSSCVHSAIPSSTSSSSCIIFLLIGCWGSSLRFLPRRLRFATSGFNSRRRSCSTSQQLFVHLFLSSFSCSGRCCCCCCCCSWEAVAVSGIPISCRSSNSFSRTQLPLLQLVRREHPSKPPSSSSSESCACISQSPWTTQFCQHFSNSMISSFHVCFW